MHTPQSRVPSTYLSHLDLSRLTILSYSPLCPSLFLSFLPLGAGAAEHGGAQRAAAVRAATHGKAWRGMASDGGASRGTRLEVVVRASSVLGDESGPLYVVAAWAFG